MDLSSALVLVFMIAQEINAIDGSWSTWSQWSECSRSCDGGLTNQRRRCLGDRFRCRGPDVKYKLCNAQACSFTFQSLEDQVCEMKNGVPINGRYYRWVPLSRQQYHCFVMCEDEHRNIPNVLEVHISDGTRCGRSTNHYCIQGKCENIGCDGFIGSRAEVDDCGVCKGDNSSCHQHAGNRLSGKPPDTPYQWDVRWEPCSATCGTGYQIASFDCKDMRYDVITYDFSCTNPRPHEITRECRARPCEPGWQVSSWSACSVPCGGGKKDRKVKCMLDTGRGRTTPSPSYRCPDPMPISETPCNMQFCPAYWQTGRWSECSVSCGIGRESRPVFCVKIPMQGSKVNVSSMECRGPKPSGVRSCSRPECYQSVSRVPAITLHNDTVLQIRRTKRIQLRVGETATLLVGQPVKMICPVQNFNKKLLFWTRNNRLIPMSRTERVFVSRNGALKIKRTDPTLDTGEFTCIAGLQSATIRLRFSSKKKAMNQGRKLMKSVIKDTASVSASLDQPQSDKVPGPRGPHAVRRAMMDAMLDSLGGDFVFTTADWNTCSRSCGKGLQTRKVTCVKATSVYIKVVNKEACNGIQRPPSVRPCVIQEQCPKWVVGEWRECSEKHCKRTGRATQSRELHCQSDNNTVIPRRRCSRLQKPVVKQECENPSCVSVWRTSGWTKCNPRCGPNGRKVRMLSCVWKVTGKSAQTNCHTIPKPIVWKKCKPKKCRKVGCSDNSRYCSVVGMLQMCTYQSFMTKCCQTCRNINNS
ncbi:ADAMTS-like protein 1 isoform X2 [Mizuhopecten yessoensis]|uniref:ADAMTS-like protein 1 isoform X2 n=1 Tax=Mizuhopecten yessoensis TaxID=6573 RepID=UPI000B45E0BF|nr:ADAMTS-like protein 1 isoform X2 [Mizuhopecten yessoensis]